MTADNGQAPLFDPLSAAFIEDPYPVYATLRASDPVHRSQMGYWVLTRHADIVAAMSDTRLSNRPSRFAVTHDRNRERYAAADVANNIIPFLDPPVHTASRKLISKAFFAQLREFPPHVAALCDRLLDEIAPRGGMEFLDDFARPLSVGVIGEVLGIATADLPRLEAWSRWFFYLFSPIPSKDVLNSLNMALDEFRAYLFAVMAERRVQPGDDLISRVIAVEEDGYRLSDTEIVDTCMLLFSDGVENVDSGLANIMLLLLEHPTVMAALIDDAALIPAALNESLRLNLPGQFISKIAKQPFEIHGRQIREHEAVILVLASANRDEAVFTQPDEFLPQRPENRHLSFGKGRHACIGAPLVEMEMAQAFTRLLSRLHDIRLADDHVEWQARLGHRWLARLPLRFETA